MSNKLLFIVLISLVLFPILRTIFLNYKYYLEPFDKDRAEILYNISQYVQTEGASWIADEILFSYAGLYYINGGSPILINPENPPLVKYIIGLSIKYLNTEKLPNIISAFLCLYCLYKLSLLILENKYLAFLPVGLLSWERLFQEQLIFMPQFETFALTFLILTIYFFIKGVKDNNINFIWANIFLGALWSTRPWMATAPLIAVWVFYLLFLKKDLFKFAVWGLLLTVSLFVLLGTYYRLILEGFSIYKILSVQKWILWYHQSRLIKLGTVWPYIFLNKWYIWWGDQSAQKIVQWTVTWPIFTFLSLLFSILILFKKIIVEEVSLIIGLWVVAYLGFLSVGNISSRYVFYLMPFCYIWGIYFFKKLWLKAYHQ